MSVISGFNILFRIYTNPLNTPIIYPSICIYFCDVELSFSLFLRKRCGALRSIQFVYLIGAVNLHLSRGLMTTSDWAMIDFKNNLILAVHLRSYND